MVYTMQDSTKIAFFRPHFESLGYDRLHEMFHTNRSIKEFPGLSWSLNVYRDYGPSVTIKIGVSIGSARATGTITVGTIVDNFDVTFDEASEKTVMHKASLYNPTDQFFVTLDVKFEIPKRFCQFKMQKLSVFDLFAGSQDDLDAQFSFFDGKIQVHSGFLSLISPVFQAMFTHNTKEAKTGVVNITDFDKKTVERVVNLCYGRDLETESTSEVVDMLRFADKYDIKAVVKNLEAIIEADLNNTNFCVITQYAWDLNRDSLKKACGKHFRQNHGLSITPEFAQMSGPVQLGVIASAASIDSSDSEQK
uniref:BTB domain-containing protein n=1 Tax=Panagrellus redivivus TaxID=6233 RepID=A0A7E4VPK4_PANRE